MSHDPLELLEVARTVAAEAGAVLARHRNERVTVAATKSSDVDVVTKVDLASEKRIREVLADLRPDDGIIGEEEAETTGTSGVTWIVDPLDGTVNYLYGLGAHCVSIAAVTGTPVPEEWTALAGAVAERGDGPMWSAAVGHGAWRDGIPLEHCEGPPLKQTLLATGFQYLRERRVVQGEVVARIVPQVRDIRRLGSCAIDLCNVAAGLVDAYYEHGGSPWDYAAGALIAQEAGVRVEGFDGRPPSGDILIAARPETFDDLHAALDAAGARDLW